MGDNSAEPLLGFEVRGPGNLPTTPTLKPPLDVSEIRLMALFDVVTYSSVRQLCFIGYIGDLTSLRVFELSS